VTTPLDRARRKLLRKVFKMPLVQSMRQRKSSITNAFVNAIIPVIAPSDDEILEAITILGMTVEDVRCAYCGDPKTQWDHLRPLVLDRRPTGYISEIANLVPACSTCNSSKRNENWRTWMLGSAPNSPTFRKIADVSERVLRLDSYEAWRPPTQIDFEALLGKEAWEHYWSLWEALNTALHEAQIVGDRMRVIVKERTHRS
jgi:hypothetical protein